MTTPKVSVVMSVYNGEKYLREAVDGILNQTFPDFEFIIVDDGSMDSTPEILEEYARKDKRVRLMQNEDNLGLTRSLNKGIQMACGEYLARQDADDVSLRERLALQVNFLDRHSEIGVVGTWINYIDESGRQMGTWRTPTSPALVHWALLFGTALAHPSALMRRSLFERDAAYRPEILYAQDYDLWVRLSAKTQLANLPQVLYLRRRHERMIGIRHYQQQEQTVKAVMQHAVVKLLDENVSGGLVDGLRRAIRGELLQTAAELQAVVDMILHLHLTYITRNTLNAAERKQVTKDVARRLEQLALRHMRRWPVGASRVLWQAFRLNPRLPITKLHLRRIIFGFLKTKLGHV